MEGSVGPPQAGSSLPSLGSRPPSHPDTQAVPQTDAHMASTHLMGA